MRRLHSGRWFLGLLLAIGLHAADVPSAEANLRRVKALVEAGAAPRSALQAAEQQLQDARSEQVLRDTLYAGNVAPADVSRMLDAAASLRDHARQALTQQQKLADEGVIPAKALDEPKQDLARADQQWELAQSRAKLTEELTEMARAEAGMLDEAERAKLDLVVQSAAKGTLSDLDFLRVESAYYQEFSHPLPVSAKGETAVHRSMGFDHRERVDVALNPDQPEGRWLMSLLDHLSVPYIAYRHAVAGRATGAHIHIGLPSPRL